MANDNYQIDPDDPFEEEIMDVINSVSNLRKILFGKEPDKEEGDYIGETKEDSL